MYWFKACYKCQGDLYRSEDLYGSYISCMHCSRYLTETEEAELMGLSRPQDVLYLADYRLADVAA